MLQSIGRLSILIALAVLVCVPAFATSSYTYKPNEYAIVTGGLAPDRHQSIRAHGVGEASMDEFHVYLYREAPQKRVGALEEIVPLDTAPDAITASWGSDSKSVAISFRSDRRVIDVIAYALANNRAYQITGPSLLQAAANVEPTTLANATTESITTWTWSSATRFRLTLSATYRGKLATVLAAFGRFGRQGETLDDGSALIAFSADATCELVGRNTYRIIDIKPGTFAQ